MMKGAAGHPGVPVVGGNIRSQMVPPQQNLQNYIVSDDIITRQKCVFLCPHTACTHPLSCPHGWCCVSLPCGSGVLAPTG